MKHTIAKTDNAALLFDGLFLTFQAEGRFTKTVRLVDEGRLIDTEAQQDFIAELLRLIVGGMKAGLIKRKREYIQLSNILMTGVTHGDFRLCPSYHLASDIYYSLREVGFLILHKAQLLTPEHCTYSSEAVDFLKSIPTRRKKASLEVAMK